LISCRELALSGSEGCRGPAFIAPALTERSERQGVPVDGRALAGHDETVLTVPCVRVYHPFVWEAGAVCKNCDQSTYHYCLCYEAFIFFINNYQITYLSLCKNYL